MLDADNHLALIRKQSANADLGGVARNAHVMIGTAGNMGAARVCALAEALNAACLAQDEKTVNRLVDELTAANVATSDAIRAWLDGETMPAKARAGA
jgi:HPt (histidine-containing phosphotransfer) domain-containing protein